jgi:hypothetical protein
LLANPEKPCRHSSDYHRLDKRHSKREAVVVSLGYEEWEWLSDVPSFGRLLMATPLPDRNVHLCGNQISDRPA